MGLVIVLYGPKAVGKTQIARLLERELGFRHVDCDRVVLELVARGVDPDPVTGWLSNTEEAVTASLAAGPVCVEATGAFESDWQLADDLSQAGNRVLRGWIFASLEISVERLRSRPEVRAPVSVEEAIAIYQAATDRAQTEAFDFTVNTNDPVDETAVVQAVREAMT